MSEHASRYMRTVHPSCMEGFMPFVTAFGLIAIMELGDNTQLINVSLAMENPWLPVMVGASAGLIAVTAIGAAIGGILALSFGAWLTIIKVIGGIVFIVLGVWSIVASLRGDEEEEKDREGSKKKWNVPSTAFFLNFLAEFGDKTQIAVIVLAATHNAPLSVFLGASLGLVLLVLLSVAIGAGLARVLNIRLVKAVSAGLFILAGALIILEALINS